MVIAGRQVKVGDALYHMAFQAWGTVIGFDGGSAKIRIVGANGHERILYAQNGGMINGARMLYWHTPLVLDAPVANIDKLQTVVNLLVQEGFLS